MRVYVAKEQATDYRYKSYEADDKNILNITSLSHRFFEAEGFSNTRGAIAANIEMMRHNEKFRLNDINSRHIYHHNEDNILASNQARAYFALSGYHFNPEDITRLLGVQPTSTNAAGASSGLDKPVISSWEISSNLITDDIDVYKLTDVIIKQLEPVKEKMLQVIKSHNLSPRVGVVLVLSIDKDESAPDVGFGARTIRFLADIGAFINVDYRLSERI